MPSIRAVLCVLVCAGLAGGERRADAASLAATRDALLERLAARIDAEDAAEPPRDFTLSFPDGIAPKGPEDRDRRGLTVELERRGTRWRIGRGRSPKYNKAEHVADASGVRIEDDRLHGELQVTIVPDAWVPTDHRPRSLVLAIDATIADGEVAGGFRARGDYGAYDGKVAGRVRPCTAQRAPDAATIAARPGADAAPAERLAVAERAYQEARAAVMALRHGIDYPAALRSCTLSRPTWPEPDEDLLAARCARLAGLLGTARERLEATPEIVADTLSVDDPGFGPYGGDEPLPVVDGRQRLPEDVGAAGGQRWHHVSRWRLLAAFPPDEQRRYDTPHLPELVPAFDARYRPDRDALGEDYDPPADAPFGWVEVASSIRQIPPPGHTYYPRLPQKKPRIDKGVHGLAAARWYAATEIDSPDELECYAAVSADDRGKLWVNDRLVWTSRRRVEPFALLRIGLRAGTNRLLFCCENLRDESNLSLMLCTRGGPLAPAKRDALVARCRTASSELPPLPCRGRVGDWTSRYPDADPPLAWDLRSGMNVRWHTPLPDYSGANPVIAGDKLLVNCEPHTLFCLDRHTGKVLWRRENHVFEFVPEEERPSALRAWARAETVDDTQEMQEFNAEIAARERKKRELERRRALDEETEAAIDGEINSLERRRKAFIRKQTGEYRRWCKRLGVGETGWSNNYGYSFGAPVSDGEHVWVKYATGVAACYDLAGERLWLRHTRLSGGVGNISSPLLLAGRFIVQGAFADRRRRREAGDGWPPFYRHYLIAFEPKTGDRVWEHPTWVTGGYGGPTGLVPLRLSDGERVHTFILTASGLVYDPRDGRLLTSCLGVGPTMWATDPMVDGNRAYFARGGRITTVEFWLEDGRVYHRVAGSTEKGVYGWCGIVQYRGRVYSNTGKSFGDQPVPWHQAGVFDLASGRNLKTIFPALRHGGLVYTPPAAAGDYAVVCGTGPGPHAWSIGPTNSAEIGFITADEDPQLVNACRVHDEAMTAAPVFHGRRMYLRTYRSACCIEVATPEGEGFVDRQRAATLLFELVPPLPKNREVHAVTAPADWRPAEGVPVEEMASKTAPAGWLAAGPFPRGGETDPLAELGGPAAARPVPGAKFGHAGETYSFQPLSADHVDAFKGYVTDLYDRKRYSAHVRIHLLGLSGGRGDHIAYYFAVIHTDAERVVDVTIKGGAEVVTTWLSGREIANNQLLRIGPGHHPLLLRVELDRLPGFIRKRGVAAGLRFADVAPPEDKWRAWRRQVAPLEDRLRALAECLPASSERLKIRRVLEILAGEGDAPRGDR